MILEEGFWEGYDANRGHEDDTMSGEMVLWREQEQVTHE